jgi:hypothetical protein
MVEPPRLELDDALEVLALTAEQSPPDRYATAAARGCRRLKVERGASLAELRLAVADVSCSPSIPGGASCEHCVNVPRTRRMDTRVETAATE